MTVASRAKKGAAIFPLMAGGLGLTMVGVLTFKFFINPYLVKKNREKSKAFADSLWEMQHSPKPEEETE